jgi:hypothetical protein
LTTCVLHVQTCIHFVGDGKDFIQFHTSGDVDETAFKLTPQFCTSPFTVLLLPEINKACVVVIYNYDRMTEFRKMKISTPMENVLTSLL